jgi:hypothetical protein
VFHLLWLSLQQAASTLKVWQLVGCLQEALPAGLQVTKLRLTWREGYGNVITRTASLPPLLLAALGALRAPPTAMGAQPRGPPSPGKVNKLGETLPSLEEGLVDVALALLLEEAADVAQVTRIALGVSLLSAQHMHRGGPQITCFLQPRPSDMGGQNRGQLVCKSARVPQASRSSSAALAEMVSAECIRKDRAETGRSCGELGEACISRGASAVASTDRRECASVGNCNEEGGSRRAETGITNTACVVFPQARPFVNVAGEARSLGPSSHVETANDGCSSDPPRDKACDQASVDARTSGKAAAERGLQGPRASRASILAELEGTDVEALERGLSAAEREDLRLALRLQAEEVDRVREPAVVPGQASKGASTSRAGQARRGPLDAFVLRTKKTT